MEKYLKKIVFGLACVVFVIVLSVPMHVQAADVLVLRGKVPKNITMFAFGEDMDYGNDITANPGVKIKNLKCSDKKIVKATVHKSGQYRRVHFYAKKQGTAKVTFDLTDGETTKSYSVKIKVYEYENPFATFKVGNTSYKAKFNKRWYYVIKKKDLSGKVSIKAKTGYQIVKIQTCDYYSRKTIKNGKKINIKNGYGQLIVTYKNKKYGYTNEAYIQVGYP